jgi:AraC-like DNA-binding protein
MNDVKFAVKTNSTIQVAEHNHAGLEIICATGDGEIVTPTEKIRYKKGNIIIIPPVAKHETFNSKTGDIHVVIEQAMLPARKISVFVDDDNGSLFSACESAVYFCESNTKNKRGILSALGNLIINLLSSYREPTKHTFIVDSIISDVNANLTDCAYSLEKYLRMLPLNYDYVRKTFKREVGVTPHEYLVGARMKLAKEILLSTKENKHLNYTCTQIAEMCGYGEPLYFSRVFKKYYGVAPSQF